MLSDREGNWEGKLQTKKKLYRLSNEQASALRMTKHKRGERGSSSSSASSPLEQKKAKTMEQEAEDSSLRNLIRGLNENMDSNFAKIHEELSCLRLEMKDQLALQTYDVLAIICFRAIEQQQLGYACYF